MENVWIKENKKEVGCLKKRGTVFKALKEINVMLQYISEFLKYNRDIDCECYMWVGGFDMNVSGDPSNCFNTISSWVAEDPKTTSDEIGVRIYSKRGYELFKVSINQEELISKRTYATYGPMCGDEMTEKLEMFVKLFYQLANM